MTIDFDNFTKVDDIIEELFEVTIGKWHNVLHGEGIELDNEGIFHVVCVCVCVAQTGLANLANSIQVKFLS